MGLAKKPGCLSSWEIAELASDLLAPQDAQTPLSHVAECSVCAAAFRQCLQDLERELTATESEAIAQYLTTRPESPHTRPVTRQRSSLAPHWAMAAAAVVVMSAGAWFFTFGGDSVPGLLADASAAARPSEFRLPDAGYGRAQLRRGAEANPPAALLEAQVALAKRAAAGERDVEYLRLQAWSELLNHQDGTAVRTLEEARRLAPNNLDVLSILGAAYAARSGAGSEAGSSSAVELLSRVLAERPADRAALYNRGLLYARLGNYPSAIADWRNLLRLETDDSWAKEVRGMLREAEAKMQ